MFKVEIDKAKKLARRVSSVHSYFRPKASEEPPPLPPKQALPEASLPPDLPARNDKPKDLVEVASSQQIREWDQGIFQLSLIRHDIYPREEPAKAEKTALATSTYHGTKRALTQAYCSIENR